MGKKIMAKPFDITAFSLIKDSDIYTKTLCNANHLLNQDADRLLYNYRVNAGLDTLDTEPYGGWEAPSRWFRGHYVGHYLSACVRSSLILHSTNQDISSELKKRADYVVDEFLKCQNALNEKEEHNGYLAAVESKMLDDLENLHFTGVHTVVYYNLHKTMCGLLDAYTLFGNKTALHILTEMAEYINFRLSRLSPKRIDEMINTIWYREDNHTFHMEFGGMVEVLVRLYAVTNNPAHLELAHKFDREWFRNMLLGDKDMLGQYSLHANTEIPCVIGLAQKAHLLDDEDACKCVDHFMDWIDKGHKLPTGGVSGRSAFTNPADYGGELFDFPNMFFKHTNFKNGESCCSHNLNILTAKEFEWTASVKWAEEYERRFVNAVLAQQNPKDGGFVYNLCMTQGSHKNHSVDGFFCCNGSGVESYSFLPNGSFFHIENKLWITNFLSCKLNWKEQAVKIEEITDFPLSDKISWTLHMESPKELIINIRIPSWTKNATLYVNDEKLSVISGEFASIKRIWQDGDIIKAVYPFELSAKAMPDRSSYVEVSYGPHLLVACTDGFASFDGSMKELIYSLKKSAAPCEFTTILSGKEVSFKPICVLTDECYNGYTIINKPAAFAVLDEVIIGNDSSEASHKFNESLSEHGITDGVNYCRAGYKGYLEYTFDLGENSFEKKLLLSCTYQDRGVFKRIEGENAEFNQCFHISIIKGEAEDLIGAQTLCETEGEALTTIYYPITTKDKTVTVRFNGSAYEGVKRGTGKLFDKVSVGFFEEK